MIKFPKKKYNDSLSFFVDYNNAKKKAIDNLDLKTLTSISHFLNLKIKQKKNIFVCGNGGSASVANHFLCDFNKGIKISSNKVVKPKIISLSNSIELMTAISNDISYNDVFANQIENYANPGDVLCTFSCSGNSKNIENAINYALKKKINIISFVGFGKNKRKNIEYYLSLNVKNYGICEDIFQGIMHMISQNIRQKFSISNL